MRVLDLFSGIGGFSLAAHAVGFDTIAFCEIESYPVRVLNRHFPDVPVFDDVKELTADALAHASRIRGPQERGTTDGSRENDGQHGTRGEVGGDALILTAGFPCQDISYAGKGAGLAGERSGLFYEVARLVGELRPDYVLLENVAALLTRGLDAVLGTLASLGYDALWACIPACAVGAPHRRDRVWIVAVPQGDNEARFRGMYEHVLSRLTPFGDLIDGWPTATASDAWANGLDRSGMVWKHNLGLGTAVRGDTWSTPRQSCYKGAPSSCVETRIEKTGYHGNIEEDVAQQHVGASGSLNPSWVETLMGYPIGYTLPDGEPMVTMPGVWPAGLGAPQHEWEPPRLTSVKENRANRLKALGNSIVPQVARLWMEAISNDQRREGRYAP